METNGTPLLSVNNIEVIYDHVILVLKGVSLEVPEGGITALLGANGAGKTTTMRILTCFMPASSGNVTVAGYDVGALPPLARMMLASATEAPPL